MAIITRASKGSALTHAEMDTNFTELNEHPNGILLPNTQNTGIKVDITTPDYPWHDVIGYLRQSPHANTAVPTTYMGGISSLLFTEGDEACACYHMPHDYVMGTPIYMHVHWSHSSAVVTGGSVTWGIEILYSKGHNQAVFTGTVTMTILQAEGGQYRHMIAEAVASDNGGSPVTLDTNALEPDGIMQCRLFLDSNDLTTSDASVPDVFAHFMDIHYQSTSVGTKNKTPDFWT